LDTGAEWIHTTRDVSVFKELLLVGSDRMTMDLFLKEEIIDYYDLPEGIFYYYNCLGRLSKNHITRCNYDNEVFLIFRVYNH